MTALAEQLTLDGTAGRMVFPAAVMTAHHGRNSAMIASVARLYAPDGAVVVDATWGLGNFWARTDTSRFRLLGSDLCSPAPAVRADFRALPIRDQGADVVVLDPPYIQRPGRRFVEARYRNRETTAALNCEGILRLYRDGMAEASRVLRPGGTLWVKCQDAVDGRRQSWSHIRIHGYALDLGMDAQDLFVLMTDTPPGGTASERQNHARRNHSYLWIFRKGHT